MGKAYEPIALSQYLKDISFINMVFKGTLVKKLNLCIRKDVLERRAIFI